MILTFADGSTTEAVLLARTENKIRVAIPGSDDPLELTDVHGTWVSEDCEPVRVAFQWQVETRGQVPAEADCICPRALAERLIRLLWTGEEDRWKTDRALSTPRPLELDAAGRGN